MTPDLRSTVRVPVVSMRELVYGPPPAPRRVRLPGRLVFAAALLGATLGCATTVQPPPAPESVGQLAPSYHSLAVAPIHHDAPPELGEVVETGDDATETVTTVTRAVDGGADCMSNVATTDHDAELPEVAPKTDGVQVGEVRQ